MKRFFRWCAKKTGINTHYRVSFLYQHSTGISVGDFTVDVSPWIHIENYMEFHEHVQGKFTDAKSGITVLNVFRIGSWREKRCR